MASIFRGTLYVPFKLFKSSCRRPWFGRVDVY